MVSINLKIEYIDGDRDLTFEDRIVFADGRPSSVNVLMYKENGVLRRFSGFIIDKAHGIVCVNRHAIEEKKPVELPKIINIKIQFNQIEEEIDGKAVYISSKYNIALIRFNPEDLGDNLKIISDVIFCTKPVSEGSECFILGNSLLNYIKSKHCSIKTSVCFNLDEKTFHFINHLYKLCDYINTTIKNDSSASQNKIKKNIVSPLSNVIHINNLLEIRNILIS